MNSSPPRVTWRPSRGGDAQGTGHNLRMTLPPALRPTLQTGLRELALDRAFAEPLLAYLALLASWNQTYNLTAIRDPQDMVG